MRIQALRNQLNSLRQREAERALESTELLRENSAGLPEGTSNNSKVNREPSQALNQQAQRMDVWSPSQQRQATSQTLQVRRAQYAAGAVANGLARPTCWRRAARAVVARLPEMPKSRSF